MGEGAGVRMDNAGVAEWGGVAPARGESVSVFRPSIRAERIQNASPSEQWIVGSRGLSDERLDVIRLIDPLSTRR